VPFNGSFWQTWWSILLTVWLSLSTNEFSSGCRAVENLGLHPNNLINSWVSCDVKHVPWSEVITLLTPNNAKICKRQSHTAFAVTDRNGNANGNRVHKSITQRQNRKSACSFRGQTTSRYMWENGISSLGITGIGTLCLLPRLLLSFDTQDNCLRNLLQF